MLEDDINDNKTNQNDSKIIRFNTNPTRILNNSLIDIARKHDTIRFKAVKSAIKASEANENNENNEYNINNLNKNSFVKKTILSNH